MAPSSLAMLSAILSLATIATGQTIVGPNESFRVTESTNDNFTLNGGALYVGAIDLSGSIELQADSSLVRISRPDNTGPTDINSSFSGSGDLTLRNTSDGLVFVSGSSTYTGQTRMKAGEFRVANPEALGTTDGITILQGGLLQLEVPTNEPIRVESGELRFSSGNVVSQTPVTLAGGLVTIPSEQDDKALNFLLEPQGGEIHFEDWSGDVNGKGDLFLSGDAVNGILAHEGNLFVTSARLNRANTYTGETVVRGSLRVNHPNALGSGDAPLHVESGTLTLNANPTGERPIRIDTGELIVNTKEPITSNITLGATWTARLVGNGTINGNIDYMSRRSGLAVIEGGTINGTIQGSGRLRLGAGRDNSPIILNAMNEINNEVIVSSGLVVVNHAEALPLSSTRAASGRLEFNVPIPQLPIFASEQFGRRSTGTVQLNVPQQSDNTWVFGNGTLEATAAIGLERLLITGTTDNSFQYVPDLTSTDTGSFDIAGELLVVHSAGLNAAIHGSGTIHAAGHKLLIINDLSAFDGQIIADNGLVTVTEDAKLGAAKIVLQDDVVFSVERDRTISNDITFQGDSDAIYRPVLKVTGAKLLGRVDVGTGNAVLDGDTSFRGQLVGNDMLLQNGNFEIQSSQEQLSGTLHARKASVQIGADAELTSVDTIWLQRQSSLIFEASELFDRLPQTANIRSQGGQVTLLSSRQTPSSETLGELTLESGSTRLGNSSANTNRSAELTVKKLDRQPGALLSYFEPGPLATTRIDDLSTFDGKMIGAWATFDRGGFLAIGPAGELQELQPTSNNLDTAGPTDHVAMSTQPSPFTSDKTVASLSVNGALDLGGKLLTVASGGVRLVHQISNGAITAGTSGPADLIFYRTNQLSADVIDNSQDGPVSLILSNLSGNTTLSGQNTYTGGTWIHGDGDSFRERVSIASTSAIPTMDRVHIDGGMYAVEFDGVARLSELHVRGSGLVAGFATVVANEYYLEDGSIRLPLSGNGTIFKDGIGEFGLGRPSPGFNGDVVVRDGILRFERDILPNAQFRIEGGRVDLVNDSNAQRFQAPFVLAGGSLSGHGLNGEIQVESASTLYANGYTTLYGSLQGDADLTIRGTLDERYFDRFVAIFGDASEFNGDIQVESGSLRIGTPAELGAGEIHVSPGTRLMLGAAEGDLPATELGNTIHLYSSTLISTNPRDDSIFSPGIVTGDVFVHGEAFVGATSLGVNSRGATSPGLTIAGRIILGDNAQVYSIGEKTPGSSLVQISGMLAVGNNTWNLSTGDLSVPGVIRPANEVGRIDFAGVKSSVDLSSTTFQASAGQMLEVQFDGRSDLIDLSNAGGISGGGKLTNDFAISNRSRIAPGDTTGKLSVVGSVTIDRWSIFEWDIVSTDGQASVDWDMLEVAGELAFRATETAPWTISIQADGDQFTQPSAPWLIAKADLVSGFDAAAVIVDITSLKTQWPSLEPSQFQLTSALGEVKLEFVGLLGDCDRNDLLDGSDLACVASLRERDYLIDSLGSVPGDLDGNRKVEFADFLILSGNFGKENVGYAGGNIDLKGKVDFADFLVQSGNFGVSPSLAAVPEPHPTLSCAWGAIMMLHCARRRRYGVRRMNQLAASVS